MRRLRRVGQTPSLQRPFHEAGEGIRICCSRWYAESQSVLDAFDYITWSGPPFSATRLGDRRCAARRDVGLCLAQRPASAEESGKGSCERKVSPTERSSV